MDHGKENKIYTKGGDTGETSLIGGKRIKKYSLRIEAYGTVDELISTIAFIKDQNIKKSVQSTILEIENQLMIVAASLSNDPTNTKHIPILNKSHIAFLEKKIDQIEKKLTPLHSFILPGGNVASSACHMARTTCRRAERRVCELAESEVVEAILIIYLNRLSDYLFVLSRKVLKDAGIKDIPWVNK